MTKRPPLPNDLVKHLRVTAQRDFDRPHHGPYSLDAGYMLALLDEIDAARAKEDNPIYVVDIVPTPEFGESFKKSWDKVGKIASEVAGSAGGKTKDPMELRLDRAEDRIASLLGDQSLLRRVDASVQAAHEHIRGVVRRTNSLEQNVSSHEHTLATLRKFLSSM